MFDEYAKKLEDLKVNVPNVFEKVAKQGALHFQKTAVELTTSEGLVDTGNYRRNWQGTSFNEGDINGIIATNTVEYASHLEYGHKLRNGKHWKGRFIGRRALDDTAYYCIKLLDKTLDRAIKKI